MKKESKRIIKMFVIKMSVILLLFYVTGCSNNKIGVGDKTDNDIRVEQDNSDIQASEGSVEGDNLYVPQVIYIDDIEYTLPMELGELLDNGWTIGEDYAELETISEDKNLELVKDEEEISVGVFSDTDTDIPVKKAKVDHIAVNCLLGMSKVKMSLSNGI